MPLTQYHLTDPDDMHPTLAQARYGKRRNADLFLGFWLALIVEAQQMNPNVRTIRRHVDKFFAGRDVQAALTEAGQDSVDAELEDAARVYYVSGLEDSAYTSTMMRMKRLTSQQVRDKAARELARAVRLALEAQLPPHLIPLLARGYLLALAPHGARELREAVEPNPQVAEALQGVLDA